MARNWEIRDESGKLVGKVSGDSGDHIHQGWFQDEQGRVWVKSAHIPGGSWVSSGPIVEENHE